MNKRGPLFKVLGGLSRKKKYFPHMKGVGALLGIYSGGQLGDSLKDRFDLQPNTEG